MLENTGQNTNQEQTVTLQNTKHNPEKATNTKHSQTKLAWFSRLL